MSAQAFTVPPGKSHPLGGDSGPGVASSMLHLSQLLTPGDGTMAFAKTMTDDNDQEYVTEIHGLTIRVNKVGGGTVGKAYKNEYWEWHVTESGIFRGHH